jgi:hypothetical protein
LKASPIHKCPTCPYTSTNKSHVTDHIKGVHDKIRDQHCHICHKVFSRPSNLRTHLKEAHAETGQPLNQDTLLDTGSTLQDHQFEERPNFVTDLAKVALLVNGDEHEGIDSKTSLNQHNFQAPNITCLLCPYAPANQTDLTQHIKEVHIEKCPHCPKVFSHENHLRDHIRAVHDMIRGQKCPHCLLTFTTTRALKDHLRHAHPELAAMTKIDTIRDKQCPLCSYSSGATAHLKDHVKAVHNKIRDQKCPFCPKVFSQISNLRVHVKKVHGEEAFNLVRFKGVR